MVNGAYGDALDLLLPQNLSAAVLLGGYRAVVFAGLGGAGVDARLAGVIQEYVAGGGTVVLRADDVAPAVAAGWLPPSFFGATLAVDAGPAVVDVLGLMDVQTGWSVSAAAAGSAVAPFCVRAADATAYVKTGGDPLVRGGWDGGSADKCCSTDAGDCVWYASSAACEAALASGGGGCRSCAAGDVDVGCPAWPAAGAPMPVALYSLEALGAATVLLEASLAGGAPARPAAVINTRGAGGGGAGSVVLLLAPGAQVMEASGRGVAAHLLARITNDTAPFAVACNVSDASGGIQYIVNAVPGGWVVALINNDGVTKQPADAEVLDPTRGRAVTLTLRPGWGALAHAEVYAGGALPPAPLPVAGGAAVSLAVPAGDVVIVRAMLV